MTKMFNYLLPWNLFWVHIYYLGLGPRVSYNFGRQGQSISEIKEFFFFFFTKLAYKLVKS